MGKKLGKILILVIVVAVGTVFIFIGRGMYLGEKAVEECQKAFPGIISDYVAVASSEMTKTFVSKGYIPTATTHDGRACGSYAADIDSYSVTDSSRTLNASINVSQGAVKLPCTYFVMLGTDPGALGGLSIDALPDAHDVLTGAAKFNCNF